MREQFSDGHHHILTEVKNLRQLRIRKMMAFKFPRVDLLFCFMTLDTDKNLKKQTVSEN